MIIKDEKLLRVACEQATIEEAKEIIILLEKALIESDKNGFPGIGLAAPQIGIAKQVLIVRIPNICNINLANHKITKTYDKALFKNEGCLSFPGIYADTHRFQEIVIENNLFTPHSFIATGLTAVVIQHETDHLNEKLLIDWKK